MTNSAEDGNVIWQKEGGGRERRKREKKKGEKERERQRERGRHWHKDITIWRPATVQLAVSSYNSQHPWRISTSHFRALWIILWVPEGFDWHPPPAPHTHTHRHELWFGPLAILLSSSVLSLPEGRASILILKDAWLGTPGLSRGYCLLCLSCFVVCFYFLGFYKWLLCCSILEEEGPPQQVTGIMWIIPWVYITPLFLSAWGVFTSMIIFMTSLWSGPKQTAHGLGSSLSGFQCS